MVNQEIQIRDKFFELFEKEPMIIRSPGRINLIGEHTDYNDGFVMPAAIDKEILFAIAPSDTEESSAYAYRFDEKITLDIVNPKPVDQPEWANYLLGVLAQLKQNNYVVKPFNCVFGGDIPMGAGLSSSAAMECGFAFAISELFRLNIPKFKVITMAQWAEHNYVGVKCGIMDQFASVMGKEGHVIMLDCRSLQYRHSPINLKDYTILLCDTKVKHSLVSSEYNTRRSECEHGVTILQKYNSNIKSLRDVSIDMLVDHRTEFPGKVYNRCYYVVQEIERVQQANKDLEKGDLKAFGKKMFETHQGLSALYEVSCPELDFLVEEARKFGEVLGSRMMGGGFGGCTINIVKKDFIESFEAHLKEVYKKTFNIDMQTYQVNVRGGTSVVSAASVPVS
jgi:galactokinase